MNYIIEYWGKIQNGDIVVSNKIKKQFEKIIYDLQNEGKYHFDLTLASRPIEFIETFCKHSKGTWAGKEIQLDLWQKAIIQTIFGFVDKNNYRRYREILVVVARKNGKSTLLSAIALYMLFGDKEGGAQVCCVASKKDQAKIVFNEAKNMVSQSNLLSKYIKKRKSDLYVPITFSTFEPLASDSNTLDGLNMHCGIIDELHSIKDRNIYDVSKQSMGARRQPLLFMITTAGFIRESIYDEIYGYAEAVINGVNQDERFLSFIYELDKYEEWTDEKYWQKANPGLSTIKSKEYLKENVQRGIDDKSFMPTLLTKDFNIRMTTDEKWLTFEIANNENKFDIENLRDTYAIGGVDLSSTTDLTCATLLIVKDNIKYVLQQYFLPSSNLERKIKDDKIPYDIWEKKGLITICNGAKVNYSDVTKWFVKMHDEYEIDAMWVGYDPWNSQYWVEEMQSSGFNMMEIRQGAKTMSAPMKQLEADLIDKKVNYNNNPILKWCLTNTAVKRDENDNIRPVKGKQQRARIDGTVSLIIAYCVLYEKFNDYTNLAGG